MGDVDRSVERTLLCTGMSVYGVEGHRNLLRVSFIGNTLKGEPVEVTAHMAEGMFDLTVGYIGRLLRIKTDAAGGLQELTHSEETGLPDNPPPGS